MNVQRKYKWRTFVQHEAFNVVNCNGKTIEVNALNKDSLNKQECIDMCTSNYTFSSKITTQNIIKMVRHDTIKSKWMTSSIRKINSYLINTVTNDTQNWGGTITTKCINISIKQIIKILNSKNQLVILNCLYEFFKKFFFYHG